MIQATREQLIAWVEAGIEYGNRFYEEHQLASEQEAALRRVARNTTQVARARNSYIGCGCPAEQAGLDGGDLAVDGFMLGFDNATRPYAAKGVRHPAPEVNLIEVVE